MYGIYIYVPLRLKELIKKTEIFYNLTLNDLLCIAATKNRHLWDLSIYIYKYIHIQNTQIHITHASATRDFLKLFSGGGVVLFCEEIL